MSYRYALGATATTADVQLAERARIPTEILLAIRRIESGSNPGVVRFEPHLFHAYTGTAGCRPGRCTSTRLLTQIRYTGVPYTPARGSVDLTRSHTNRAAFERARGYDEEAAIRSTSWGLYQVLGGLLLRVRPSNPVEAFDRDPRTVSDELLVEWFTRRSRAAAAARAFDIPELARLYNGSQRWADRVSTQLARIRREGLDIVEGPASTVETAVAEFPVVPVVGAAAIAAAGGFAFWAWWRSR